MAAEKKVYFQTQPLLQKIEELHQKGQKAELDKRVAQWQEFVKKYPFLDKMISDKLKQILLGESLETSTDKFALLNKFVSSKTKNEMEQLLIKPFLMNLSSNIIFFKPESSIFGFFNNMAYPVPIFGSVLLPVDGVATPPHRNQVYKITDVNFIPGGGVVVWPNGSVSFTNLTLHLANELGVWKLQGGWKDTAWQQEQNRKGDNTWDALFETSRNF